MTTVLHIASSSRLQGSLSREIGTLTLAGLRERDPGLKVIERDLAKNPLPHLTQEFVAALAAPGTPPLALSDTLIDELIAADTILIEAPMYNFGIPSALKAWIDHVVRAGRTFSYEGGKPAGKLKGKKVILVLAQGGIYHDLPYKAMDYQETYLRAILGFIGLTDIETIHVSGVAMGPEAAAQALTKARESVAGLTRKAA